MSKKDSKSTQKKKQTKILRRTEEVRIEKLVYGGDGLARMKDGRAVFVPFVLPDELVKIQVQQSKKRFTRAELLEVLEPSPDRISPRCKHFMKCGGCHYQHMNYSNQAKMKELVFREQLERIAGVKGDLIKPMIRSADQWNYRNSLQFHLSTNGITGFQASRSHNVVEIEECYLPQEPISQVWPLLDMTPYLGLERIEIKTGSDGEVLLGFHNDGQELPSMELDLPVSAVNLSPLGEIVMAGDNYVLMQVLERTFSVSAGSFFQMNPLMTAEIVRYVMTEAPISKDSVILDVYCGVGLFSAFMASEAALCVGVEASTSACQDFVVNLDQFENVQLFEGLAEKVLPGLDLEPDLILVDPPRSGLHANALDAIVNLRPETVFYVSCDPATLARDLSRFRKQGYEIEKITPFDLLPQTYHIESITILKKSGK